MSRLTAAERRKLKAKAIKMYESRGTQKKTSVADIARTLDVHQQTVSGWLAQAGITVDKRWYDHEAIAADIRGGARQVDIIRKYGCSWDFVRRLKQKVKRGEL